ncbi:MAG: NUDIX hydrolase [Bacillaceae bacterium]|nr:NUDIX hydrolase [Bacillaceae bacterium]
MKKWEGSAAVCLNQHGQFLMVLQGKPEEEKKWSIPSGELESGETPEQCCIREVYEETGYHVEIKEKLFVKQTSDGPYEVTVHYFLTDLKGGTPVIHDPDGLIYEIGWKSAGVIRHLDLSFPEDREILLQLSETCSFNQDG